MAFFMIFPSYWEWKIRVGCIQFPEWCFWFPWCFFSRDGVFSSREGACGSHKGVSGSHGVLGSRLGVLGSHPSTIASLQLRSGRVHCDRELNVGFCCCRGAAATQQFSLACSQHLQS